MFGPNFYLLSFVVQLRCTQPSSYRFYPSHQQNNIHMQMCRSLLPTMYSPTDIFRLKKFTNRTVYIHQFWSRFESLLNPTTSRHTTVTNFRPVPFAQKCADLWLYSVSCEIRTNLFPISQVWNYVTLPVHQYFKRNIISRWKLCPLFESLPFLESVRMID